MRALERSEVEDVTRVPAIVLIGFQSMGNLDIELPEDELVAAVTEAQPMLVGFSLIFQFYIRRYASLMEALRREGCDAHFTMGGHYPTLSPQQTLAAAPDLDSIVRYEGEVTLLEIV